MNPGALFVFLLLWPLVWGWSLDVLLYVGNFLASRRSG
jgi:hypothetical protein